MKVGTLTVIEVYYRGELVGRGYIINDKDYSYSPTIYDLEGNELPHGWYDLKFRDTYPVVISDMIH